MSSSSSSNLMATHASCLPVGTVVADFEIVGLVGEGGFGIVYLARDMALDRVVALKEFMPAAFAGRVDGVRVAVRAANNQATYEAGLRSFINEAKMLAKFAHPALVEVYRFWEGNGTAYMAMRYYSGETLRQHLARGDMTFDEEAIAQIMAPVFDTLELLHREQVFHRDIAPDNIMLSDGKPVLLDFGSARRIIGDGTQALTTILKPGYAPVEQYVDDGTMKQGPWTDVYALGGVLYHLATGKAPLQAVSRLLSDPLPTVNQATQDAFSSRFSAAVAQAMAVRVEDRLKTVKDLRDALGWNVVQSARVVTLPSHSLAKPAAEAAPVAAPSPAPVQQPAAADLAKPVTTPLPDGLAGSREKPAYPPDAPKSLPRAALAAIAMVLLAAVAWLGYAYTRPAATLTQAVPTAPTVVAVPVKELPASAVPVAEAAVASASAATGLPKMGKVNLNIVPWGAVVIDGVTRGISNPNQLRQMELPVGTHTIEIAKPDAPPLKQTIEVGDAPVSISHTFK